MTSFAIKYFKLKENMNTNNSFTDDVIKRCDQLRSVIRVLAHITDEELIQLAKNMALYHPATFLQCYNDKESKIPQDALTQIHTMVATGGLINGIKLYREITGVGLKEAKDAVERMCSI